MSRHGPHPTSGPIEEPKKSKKELIRASLRLFRYLVPFWPLAVTLFLVNLVLTGLSLISPLLTKYLIDGALANKDIRILTIVCVVALAALLTRAILQYPYSYFSHWVGQEIIYKLRTDVYEHVQGLSVRFFEDKPTGEIMSRTVNDTEAVETFIVHAIERFMSSIMTIIVIVIYMFAVNPKLALLAAFPIPLLILQVVVFARRFRGIFKTVRERIAALNTFLQERVSGVRIVKAFGREEMEAQGFRQVARACYDSFMRAVKYFSMFGVVMTVLTGVGGLMVMYFGGKLAIRGDLSTGDLVAFLMYTGMFYGPIGELGHLFGHWLPRSLAAADRIFEFLDTKDRPTVLPGAVSPERVQGSIEFRNVWFKYADQDVLRNINLTVAPGETVALVGRSGVGKTTMADLIPRFYDPTQGQVLVDGIDVQGYELDALRRQISIVLQEPFLFNTSIRENIAYGKPEATDEEIRAAATMAGAAEFIEAIPEKYDAVVGERGVKLSVGEKQRVSIARALIKNPAILILDEATSSVDTETEKVIQQALERAARGRTTIIIAHRLSTTTIANRVAVLAEGEIAELGSPAELLARDGIYARLWKMQSLEPLTEDKV